MKKIIKWSGFIFALVVLISLFYYVKDKKNKPAVSSDDLLKAALIEIRDHKNYTKAIELSKQALISTPDYTDLQVTLGRAYLLNGNTDSAKFYLNKAVAANSNNGDAFAYLFNISMQEKDTAAALQYLTTYISHHPEDEKNSLKRYALLLQYRQYENAESAYRSFIERFPRDSIRAAAFDYWKTTAVMQHKSGNLADAYKSYRKALRYDPADTATLLKLITLEIYYKDYEAAKHYNDILLRTDSTNRIYLVSASSISESLNDHALAAEYAGKAFALNPKDKLAEKNLIDLYLASAKESTPENKIRYAKLILNVRPSQKEALLYAINGYLELKQNRDALSITERALTYYPSDKIFIDKKVGILFETKNYAACADYLESVLIQYPNNHFIKEYDDVALSLATEFIRNKKWTDALTTIQKGLNYNKNNRGLLEQLVNVYASLDMTAEAIVIDDQLISLDHNNAAYLFKKAGLLEKEQHFSEASGITYSLLMQYPAITEYKTAYIDELTNEEKYQLSQQQWDKVVELYNKVSAVSKPGYFSLLYGLTAYSETGDQQHALLLIDTALSSYPNDSLFLVKRSLANVSLQNFSTALGIDHSLLLRYPSDTSLQKMYLDQLYTAGKYYEKENNDTALSVFFTAFAFAPKDTFALQNLSAIYFVKRKYDSAAYYADLGLQLDSNNEYLLMKRASSYEQLKNYKEAFVSADRLSKINASANLIDYAAYLKNKTYLNQLGVSHLQSFFSSPGQYASVTGIQYMCRFTKGSVTAKLNLGSRLAGTAVQAGLDAYYTHNSKYYSNAFINWSPGTAFPYWQAGYSLFRTFTKGWEAELGARYIGFDSVNNYSAVVSVGKYFDNTWLNLRGFYTTDSKNWYQSYLLSARQYLNDKGDYISALAGLGGIPDDQSLNYNLSHSSGFVSKTIGAGFQKSFRYRTTLNASFNYTNLQVSSSVKLNQYDFYITLLRNF